MRFLTALRHPNLAQVRASWDRFQRGQSDPSAELRPYVRRAWERSRQAGCDPRAARADRLSPEACGRLLAEQQSFIDVLAPFLQALSLAAGSDRHAAMLADRDGRLLRIAGDAETMADDNFPQAGALLSEQAAGANGVGTALAEQGYVELVGPEHFIEGFHAFTCQGVPLEGPDGRLAGVLSMSVRRLAAADRVRDILFCASEAASCELIARELSGTALGNRTLERLRQDVVQRVTQARLRLELAARQIAAGTAARDSLQIASALSRQFERQAALWRDLALAPVGNVEVIELADLVEDFLGLLQTEARLARVRWSLAAEERLQVLDDRVGLARRLLSAALSSLQSAAPSSVIEVAIRRGGSPPGAQACVELTALVPGDAAATARPVVLRVCSPLLRRSV